MVNTKVGIITKVDIFLKKYKEIFSTAMSTWDVLQIVIQRDPYKLSTELLVDFLRLCNGLYRMDCRLISDRCYDRLYLTELVNRDPDHEWLQTVEPEYPWIDWDVAINEYLTHITFKTGDLLLDRSEALVNTVNTVGVMGKGIALQFKNRYPDMYFNYRQACMEDKVHTGKMCVIRMDDINIADSPKYIINFPTKRHWRNPSTYTYIKEGLDDLIVTINKLKIKSIALPALGCSNGGLDWYQVKDLMISHLADVKDVKITIYEPLK